MARIKIEITGTLLFTAIIPVRITDINYGNHTGNDSIVALMHEARMQWLHQYGYTELDINETGLIMSDLLVEFKNESHYGDTLFIELFANGITKKSFDLYYHITTIHNNNKILVAKAKTGMVCFDYSSKKVVTMPAELMKILAREV